MSSEVENGPPHESLPSENIETPGCIDGADMFEPHSVDDADCWVKYSVRPDWSDVTPVPQHDGDSPVVRIAYSSKFVDVYDYFRAVLQSGEVSMRALRLTSAALELNPANYTVWHHRRYLIFSLKCPLLPELQYVKQMMEDHPKNYQVWHHRKVLVDKLDDPKDEQRVTEIILRQDAKNFHAWQYRQWVVKRFNLFDRELDFAEQLIDEDVRNNSAWNQRYFVITGTTGFTLEVIPREVTFCLEAIRKVKQNESAWSYLRGVLVHAPAGLATNDYGVREFCEGLLAAGCRAPQLLAFVLDLCVERAEAGETECAPRALRLCQELAKEHDTIREEYWLYRRRVIVSKFGEERGKGDEHKDEESKDSERGVEEAK